MVTCTKANGSETRLMVKDFILIATVLNIKENGKMICSTVSVPRLGERNKNIKVSI